MLLNPCIVYEEALKKQFRWKEKVYQVEHAPPEMFRAFIEDCGQQKKWSNEWTRVLLNDLLAQIDEQCDELTRWYCIDVLLSHRVPVAFV